MNTSSSSSSPSPAPSSGSGSSSNRKQKRRRSRSQSSATNKWWHNKRLYRGVIALALSIAATFFFSRFLMKLSGGALWMPKEWRITVSIIAVLLGTSVFHLSRIPSSRQSDSKKHHGSANEYSHRTNYMKSILCCVLAAGLLVPYMIMRARCLVSWDPRDWVRHEIHEQSLAATAESVAAKRVSGQRNELGADIDDTENVARNDKAFKSTQIAGGELKRLLPDPPSFIDLDEQQIYVPLRFPATERSYLENLPKAHPEIGAGEQLNYVLANEPDRLIDWLRGGPCQMALAYTTCAFLALHLAIVAMASLAAGFSYDPVESVVDAVVEGISKGSIP